MNLLSINIRGFGVEKKASWIKDIKVREKVSFLAFQETIRSDISDADIERFWGRSVWAKEAVNPSGRSGGLLCVWDPGMFCLNSVSKDSNFLLLSGSVKGCVEEVNILNVYAPQKLVEKRALWSRILAAKAGKEGLWILAGDFNVVRSAEERNNSCFKAQCARDFNQFIYEAELCDYDLKGSRFIYMVDGENGKKFSKIDRVLSSSEVAFRSQPSSLGGQGFELCAEGPPDLCFTLKLRYLRQKIKEWRDGLRGREGEEEEKVKSELEKLDEEMEYRDLTEEEEWVRLECKKKLLETESIKAKDLRKRSREDFLVRPELVCSFDKKLSEEDATFLSKEFSKEEIKQACFDCGSERAPGPDGFNMKFFKRFWDRFKEDFVNIFKQFFVSGSFSRANKLKTVIGSVIKNQSAFLKDRLILDGPLIINEVLAWARENGTELFLFKIDFAKAYDNVNWNFLSSIMNQLGFPPKWCLWIHGILSLARSSVLVNGSPTFEFPCQKGMRQGDPISPFLFLLVMEAFSSVIKKACRVGAFRGIQLPKEGSVLSHLLYTNDSVLIGEWARNNIKKVALLLRCFYMCSGLKINMNKSSLFGVGVGVSEVEDMAAVLSCSVGNLSFFHLGILVGADEV
ncbi:uncharacterized protein LOC110870307 [Helianthus annuus]|uniref:uncharacterized protein LOC110870307 n=1 Tax=Helianthus annuus TaxID=4232 RepID=UPI000B8F6B8C|nr:uncharacterized protein LOC110870307 [Helianthus annuus]